MAKSDPQKMNSQQEGFLDEAIEHSLEYLKEHSSHPPVLVTKADGLKKVLVLDLAEAFSEEHPIEAIRWHCARALYENGVRIENISVMLMIGLGMMIRTTLDEIGNAIDNPQAYNPVESLMLSYVIMPGRRFMLRAFVIERDDSGKVLSLNESEDVPKEGQHDPHLQTICNMLEAMA